MARCARKRRMTPRLWLAALALAAMAALPGAASARTGDLAPVALREPQQVGGAGVQLKILSSRSDMISGGDALAEVSWSEAVAGPVTVLLNGRDVTAAFQPAPAARTRRGLLTGLKLGPNLLEARAGLGGRPAQLTLTNYPASGPIFAGPKETPFICMTQSFELPAALGALGAPLDADCAAKTRVDYVYRATDGTFKALPNVRERPADLALATTRDGLNVPYIVRLETGTVDRAIYQFAVLHDPATEPDVAFSRRPRAWNGAVVYQFGGGCPGGYNIQGKTTGGVLDDYMLSRGYAEASSSLNVYGNNCDDLLASEAMMMVKERVVERLGPPTFTIGWGCSGGSYQAEQIADNYPGLLDGIVVGCSFPDVGHAAVSVHSFGARLVHHYFEGSRLPWTDEQKVAVAGLPDAVSLQVQGTRPDRIDPTNCNEALPAALRWDPATRPKGVRCTIYEHGANGFGRDPATGLARRPLDNVGVQYGLKALNAGVISKAQFLDLNGRIGGVDIDARFVPTRTVGDPIALERAYRTGRFLSTGGGLKTTPIIDYRAYADFDKGDPHQRFHSFSFRERLIKANGNADNQVMLAESHKYGLFSLKSPVLRGALDAMDQWIANLQSAGGPISAAAVVAAKPAGLTDACFTPSDEKLTERQVYAGDTACNRLYPPHGNPYIAAGLSVANDIVKCTLKPIDPADYAVTFTAAELQQLRAAFPGGVCDWTRPGVGQAPLMGAWLSFGPAGRPAVKSKRVGAD